MNNSELAQIADILPPAAPVSPPVDSWLYFFLLIAVVTVVGFWYLRSSKQQLRRLRKQYQQHKIDNRQCAFQLTSLLRQNNQRQDISTSLFSPQQNNLAWQEYSSALQVACYSRRSLDDETMSQLLRETERWL